MKERIQGEIGQSDPVPAKEHTVETATEMAVQIEDVKETVEADVRINGRPTFTKKFDRFVWDLENDMVDASTEKLAEKNQDIWEMAKKEYERRQVS